LCKRDALPGVRDRMLESLGKLVVGPSLQQPSGSGLSNASPLFKEKGNMGFFTLFLNELNRPSLLTDFKNYNLKQLDSTVTPWNDEKNTIIYDGTPGRLLEK